MNKFEIRTNKKKEAIILASLRLFGNYGFKRTNIKMIAAEAHVSQVSIYNYFGDKESLIAYCIEYLMQDISNQSDAILAEEISFEEKLEKIFKICDIGLQRKISKYFSEEILQEKKLKDKILENCISYKRNISQKIIELGKAENKIKNTIQTSSILSLIDMVNVLGSEMSLEKSYEFSEEMKQLLFYGILK